MNSGGARSCWAWRRAGMPAAGSGSGRGEAPADLDALANAIAAFSQLPFLEPGIQEADLNPVFVFEDKILTADARILYAKKEG